MNIAFDLSWDDCNTREKLENKMHHGLCENGEVNTREQIFIKAHNTNMNV